MKKLIIILVIIGLVFSQNVLSFAEGESSSIVSSGYGSTYVIKNDGSLWGWGYEYIGNGNKDRQITPVKILDNVKSVSANTFGGIAIKKDDTLWAWGSLNGYLIKGEGNDPTYLFPKKIMDDVKIAAMGNDYIAVIKMDDSLWICGDMFLGDGSDNLADSSNGFVEVMKNISDIYAGNDTIYVIKDDDTLWGWGNNSKAELGNMSLEDTKTPVKILDDVKLVRKNGSTVMAIRLDNSLYSWGFGGNNGIYTENGWIEDAGAPYKVMDNVTAVTMLQNGSGVLVVKIDSTLWGWNNQWNDEGDKMTPYKYTDNVSYVSNGERHAAVVKKDNTLWTMGGNYRDGLGYDIDETWYTPLTKILDNIQDAPASWAMEEVEKAIGEHLIPEEMQNNYTKPVTREEFCILAIRMMEVKSGMNIDDYLVLRGIKLAPAFDDCDTKEVLAAKALKIAKGTSATTFDPDMLLNREMAAVFLTQTAQASGRDVILSTPNYADVNEISDWAKGYTGYVYDIGIITGTTGNRFDAKGSFQRQQAFMTMYRIWNAIDEIIMDKVEDSQSNNDSEKKTEFSKENLSNLNAPNEFTVLIEGVTKSPESTEALKYDMYYKNTNVRIDTYWDGSMASKMIYNSKEDATYTEAMMFTHYAEYMKGNLLPIRLLNLNYLEKLEIDNEKEFFTSHYETLNDEKVLYIKSSIKNGVTTEMWYSLEYLIPIKFHEVFIEEEGVTTIDWSVVKLDKTTAVEDSLFDIPNDATIMTPSIFEDDDVVGDARDLLLYKVKTIDSDEDGIMHKVSYYSEASYEVLVGYFKILLEGTDDYSIYVQDGRTSIDGSINGELVIVIINDYMTTEPEVGMNGVNVNY